MDKVCTIEGCPRFVLARGWCGYHYSRWRELGSPHAQRKGIEIRPIRIDGDIAHVALTRGRNSVIDASDVHLIEGKNWSYVRGKSGVEYAKSSIGRNGFLALHAKIMQPPPGYVVDHINRDGLDNRRANLRLATASQNAANKIGKRNGSSKYKGVCLAKDNGKWQAMICVMGVKKYLGQFLTEEEAHKVYCEAAKEAFGEYARFS